VVDELGCAEDDRLAEDDGLADGEEAADEGALGEEEAAEGALEETAGATGALAAATRAGTWAGKRPENPTPARPREDAGLAIALELRIAKDEDAALDDSGLSVRAFGNTP
jgi:hypothetical protein